MLYTFNSELSLVRKIQGKVSREMIHEEPMLFGCSIEFAKSYGGVLTKAALAAIGSNVVMTKAWCKENKHYIVIDTRSHMLMPYQYPAIPGWHCDAVPRNGYGTQPELGKCLPGFHHYTVFMSDQDNGVSNTLFMADGSDHVVDVNPEHVWESVHNAVKNDADNIHRASDGEVYRFSQKTLHTAAPCHQKGWRFWFRLSCFPKEPENVIRKQVQVYTTEGGGW